jgi:hypothetical protein
MHYTRTIASLDWKIRYMDDIIVLAPRRWKLRKAVRVVNQTLDGLGSKPK